MPSKDCSHAKLTKVWQNGKAEFLPQYHVTVVGKQCFHGVANIVGLFVAIKTSEYYYYC